MRAYLDIEGLIAAAKATGCDSIHPGYGFLFESPALAKRCLEEGIAFIGPRPETLALFGDKTKARDSGLSRSVSRSIPGSPNTLASAEDAIAVSKKIGYPVNAESGRRRRRSRHARCPERRPNGGCLRALPERSASGVRRRLVFIEKLIARPRHIEVQVLGDGDGNIVHLYERDCSVQLRNQKMIEVAPAPGLDASLSSDE